MILMRHGQSTFNVVYNVTRVDPGILDPPLTEAGRRQALEVAQGLRGRGFQRLLTSPYRRALETADLVAGVLGLAVVVEPLVRERHAFHCDIGSPRSELQARWPHLAFDHLAERWWPEDEETEAELHARCMAFRRLVAAWDDHEGVLAVSHWGFIRALTGVPATNAELVPFNPG